MAAIILAEAGQPALVIERMHLPGGKIPVTGGGHCNLTHRGTAEELSLAYHEAERLMKRALLAFGPEDLRQLLRSEGLATYYDEKDCCYPRSERAEDVVRTLYRAALKRGVHFLFGYELRQLEFSRRSQRYKIRVQRSEMKRQPSKWPRLERLEALVNKEADAEMKRDRVIESPAVILATGSPAFYRPSDAPRPIFALELLRDFAVPLTPALTALKDPQFAELSGMSLDDAALCLSDERGRCLEKERGTLLFTHRGLSGPLPLNFSRHLRELETSEGGNLRVSLNFCPDQTEAELREIIATARREEGKQRMVPKLFASLPRRLWPFLMSQSGLPRDFTFADCSKDQERRLIMHIQAYPLKLSKMTMAEAMLARGGIQVAALKAKSLEFKDYPRLFACGECLDIDGRSGGYNLQAAFSTAYLAARGLLSSP